MGLKPFLHEVFENGIASLNQTTMGLKRMMLFEVLKEMVL